MTELILNESIVVACIISTIILFVLNIVIWLRAELRWTEEAQDMHKDILTTTDTEQWTRSGIHRVLETMKTQAATNRRKQ